jgi:hypothetical protein
MALSLNGTTGVTFPDGFTQASALATPISIANGGTGLGTIGANNTVLTSNGTSASWVAPAGGQPQSQLFSSSGTWTCPAGVTRIKVSIFGAGGGGSGSCGGGRGGLGGMGWNYFTVTPGTGYAVTIGTGGTGSNVGNGTSGTTSSLGSLITATGGGGGTNTGVNGAIGSCANNLTGDFSNVSWNFIPISGDLLGFLGSLRRDGSSNSPLTWSNSIGFVPGSSGGEASGIGGGGVNGAILIEYLG